MIFSLHIVAKSASHVWRLRPIWRRMPTRNPLWLPICCVLYAMRVLSVLYMYHFGIDVPFLPTDSFMCSTLLLETGSRQLWPTRWCLWLSRASFGPTAPPLPPPPPLHRHPQYRRRPRCSCRWRTCRSPAGSCSRSARCFSS